MTERSDLIAQISLDDAADAMDRAVLGVQSGTMSPFEAINVLASHTAWFVQQSLGDPPEHDLIIDYGRDSATAVADHVHDPILVEFFEDQLESLRLGPEIEARLYNALDDIEAAIVDGDPNASLRLTELCRHGYRSDRVMLSVGNSALAVLRVAYRLRHVEALADAVSPRYAGAGQIANPYETPDAYRFALDALAHLASDPDDATGIEARAALVELAGHIDIAGDVAVRLPIHLLSDDDRSSLLEAHEARSALFEDDPVFVPVGLEMLRANRVLRNALWQAFDAQHLA